MDMNTFFAGISAFAAIGSAAVAILAHHKTKAAIALQQQAYEQQKRELDSHVRMFKREGVIDLYMAWQGTNRIDPNQPITGDVIKAVGSLELTAALWNHDVIDKEIIYQSYWDSYRELYETVNNSVTSVPGMTKRLRDFISAPVSKAYQEMSKRATESIQSTSVTWRTGDRP